MPKLNSFVCHTMLACSVLICTIVGCGDGNAVKVYPTSGTVIYKDKPLDNATVNFIIAGKDGQPSTVIGIGMTDKDGKYKIVTNVDPSKPAYDGAVEGTHQVSIHKFMPPKGMTMEDISKMQARETKLMEENGFVPPEAITPSLIPALPPKYQNPTQSELSATVKPGEKNEFNFNLK